MLQEPDLYDGLYLVGAFNHQFVGHAIVLQVAGKLRLLYEGASVSRATLRPGSISTLSFGRLR